MNAFFEKILRESPELQEEIIGFQQWGRNALSSANAEMSGRNDAIAWNPPDASQNQQRSREATLEVIGRFTLCVREEIVHSEEEMLGTIRSIGDRVFRADLEQTFIFMGGDPSEIKNYFRLLTIANNYAVGLHPNPSLYQQWVTILRAYEESILLNGGVPASIVEPAVHDNRGTSTEVEERSPKSSVVNQTNCKFYNDNTLLRCAVNPCVKTCDGCTQFEPKR